MNRRQKLTTWMSRKVAWWDDYVISKHIPDKDWAYAPEWGVINKVCRLLRAHVVVDDQCMKPEHRFCVNCHTAQPNAPVHKGSW